jgi:hypothetical protein
LRQARNATQSEIIEIKDLKYQKSMTIMILKIMKIRIMTMIMMMMIMTMTMIVVYDHILKFSIPS